MSTYNIKKIKNIYQGKLLHIALNEVTFPDGKSSVRETVVHPGAVAIVPFIDEDHVILIEQFRTAADQILWEIPAGTLEKDEDPIDCAKRELIEETGYRADTMNKLASFFLAPGYSTEVIHLFAAHGLSKEGQKLEEDERIKPHILSIEKAKQFLKAGKILDAKTIIGLLLAVA